MAVLLAGPLDGVPLDGAAEAIVIGLVLPALWWFHPAFLRTRLARACMVGLLVWKACTAMESRQAPRTCRRR